MTTTFSPGSAASRSGRAGGPLTVPPQERASIRRRVRALLADAGLDGYIAFTPSNVSYLSGYISYFLSTWWRMHGTVMAAITTDEGTRPVLVLGDGEEASARAAIDDCDIRAYPMWIETRGHAQILEDHGSEPTRPSQWREDDIDTTFTGALGDLGMLSGRIGTDLRFLPYASVERLRRIAPHVEWVDATDLMYEVRAVKEPFEIERLRAAGELAEAGMVASAESAVEGTTLAEVRTEFFRGVADLSRSSRRYDEFSDLWVLPGLGADAAVSSVSGPEATFKQGDLLKFDCGTTVGGYRSDHGRTFVLGTPSDKARVLYERLREAQALAIATMVPGTPITELFRAAESHMDAHGYPGYRRGHFGHSIGMDTFHEEPPFLGRHDEGVFEVNQVFSVETPFYGPDLGPIMIEDMVLVTEKGPEMLTHLPHELMQAGTRP